MHIARRNPVSTRSIDEVIHIWQGYLSGRIYKLLDRGSTTSPMGYSHTRIPSVERFNKVVPDDINDQTGSDLARLRTTWIQYLRYSRRRRGCFLAKPGNEPGWSIISIHLNCNNSSQISKPTSAFSRLDHRLNAILVEQLQRFIILKCIKHHTTISENARLYPRPMNRPQLE
ncbi:hypothetical protein BU24DRAFT_284596 [Aaosphaeria arxii CBS 175.79]|uniref:Uncharacterized protein n=1 Tax=Aaosphaeria arxii CBS 175.79 TaxID=1450172 RepID=A0A6A5XEH0_9PLEO|nr:uncharacterized protein BU24DRAFT_284596 [Aaosphaeria arxii CBS 175.79]KAF2011605.1 hypothetical protein BU24DRAFT_284596 [Aaosphaeria arxii CBS 175.79]